MASPSVDDIREVFTTSFHFGCEADDPMTALAFDRDRPGGHASRRCSRPTSGTGTFPTSAAVLPEAWELVEDGHATEADFRALTFGHAVSLWAGANPSFFDGTTVEEAVHDELERLSSERAYAGANRQRGIASHVMTTVVLVHGAFHGAWCWEPVRSLLDERGIANLAPDLPLAGLDVDAATVRRRARCGRRAGRVVRPLVRRHGDLAGGEWA